MTIGAELAHARSAAGLSLAKVSELTRVREDVLQGMESDDFTRCRGASYARGHLRAYAGAVGLDPEPLLREFETAHAADPVPPGRPVLPVPVRSPGRGTPRIVVVALAVALLAMIALLLATVVDNGSTGAAPASSGVIDASGGTGTPSVVAVSEDSAPRPHEKAGVTPRRHLR